MSKESLSDAKEAIFDYFVDTLVDLADPDDENRELVYGDMAQLTHIIFEGLDLQVDSRDDDRIILSVRI